MSNAERDNMPVHYSAQMYDRYTESFLGRFDDLLLTRLRQEVHVNPAGRHLLDAGCGTARFLLRLTSLPELNHLSLTGLDYFEDMVEVSRENVRRQDLGNRLKVIRGDMHHLPFDNEAFDFIISRSTLHHLADPAAAMIEIRRCLSPGGVALIHEVRCDADPRALAHFNRLRAEAGLEASRIKEKYTAAEIRGFIEKSGLGAEATIIAPSQGYASLGCEVRISARRKKAL